MTNQPPGVHGGLRTLISSGPAVRMAGQLGDHRPGDLSGNQPSIHLTPGQAAPPRTSTFHHIQSNKACQVPGCRSLLAPNHALTNPRKPT